MLLRYKSYSYELVPVTEDYMIGKFLLAEIKSKRFSEKIHQAIGHLGLNEIVVTEPDFESKRNNQSRRSILEVTRKFTTRSDLFEGFPHGVKWYRVMVSKEFLMEEVLYIDYDYWVELTNGSRFPKDAVKRIRENNRVYNVPFDNFIEASEAFAKSKQFDDEIIVVTNLQRFVVLEGHLRMTVYALNSDILPDRMPIILGISEEMDKWTSF